MSDEKKMPSAILRGRGLRLLFGDQWPGDPSANQTEEQIREYYTGANEGDVAVIRQTYANRLFFIVSKVTGKNGKGRVYLADEPASGYGGCAFWIKSGKNCFSPKGQARLVVPTPEVLAHAERYPAKDFGMRLEIDVADVPKLIERQRGEK
ncbi:hypothetical protein [Bradyrhizobium liaoningense]|jgi:hypothetical protein